LPQPLWRWAATVALSIAMTSIAFGQAPAKAQAAPALTAPPAPSVRSGTLVFGGTRATGLEIVRLLRTRGEAVTVVVRPTSDVASLRALGASTLVADAMDAAAVNKALTGTQFRTVISTLGTTRGEKDRRPDFVGNKNAIDAAKAAGIPRFVLITVIGAGNSSDAAPWLAKQFLKEVIELKTQAEDYLKQSGLQWTIVRPGGLLDKKSSGQAVLKTDPETFSWISRVDLAQLTVDVLDAPGAAGQVYAAYDPTRENFWSMWGD
jgi:uncharacterized protein YbjT (DUF2867 family)